MRERAGGDQARILVVDDTPANAKLLSDLIEHHGYVATAAAGPEAIAALQRATYDLVLLDIVMPGMDGYDVCRTIRNDADVRR